ncbi:MAG TPA: LacI family transcriptional regulator [Anaerolineae bacterium]|nr:LacI family transcriptional regulator [Caldilineae bacterium]HID33252.1 LacI family transcriptional regulator [Anaerolineae bacterium]
MSQRPSIKDIARIAGVSPSTVSRALADSSRISEATRQRIQTIARELAYTPSLAARALVTGASPIIGVVAPSLADPYIASVMRGLEEASHRRGYQRLVASTQGDPEQELAMVQMLAGHNVAGLIVLSSRVAEGYASLLERLSMPVIFVNSLHVGEQVYNVMTDNEYGGWLATQHLIRQGHARIAYLGGPWRGRSHAARAAGYRRAIEEAGLSFDPACLIPGDGSIQAGREALHWWLNQPECQRPTAIFCYNDLSALGLLAEAYQQGVVIPDHLSVVGFDNLPMAAISIPPLTTVEQRTKELGSQAIALLLAVLEEKPVTDVILRGELVVRASVRRLEE